MGSGEFAERIGGEFLMADYLTTDTELTSVADAIRAKGGTSDSLVYPAGFVRAIEALGGGAKYAGHAIPTLMTVPGYYGQVGYAATVGDGSALDEGTLVALTPPTGGTAAYYHKFCINSDDTDANNYYYMRYGGATVTGRLYEDGETILLMLNSAMINDVKVYYWDLIGGTNSVDSNARFVGQCYTDASTATKTVKIPAVRSFQNGMIINVLFSNGNTASTMWLDINSSGPKEVYAPGNVQNIQLPANTMVTMVYFGSSWRIPMGFTPSGT